jgi:Glycosyl hydrolases family 43
MRRSERTAHPRRRVLAGGLLLALAMAAAACQPPPSLGVVARQTPAAPQWPLLGDPAVLYANGHYYVFSSNTSSNRLPVHVVDSLTQTYSIQGWDSIVQEAMPQPPAWAADNVLWAPTVAHIGSTYVLFFAANRVNPPDPNNRQCIGRATASSPTGPYTAEPFPFSCGLGGTGGALDPSLFQAPDGKWFLDAAFGSTESPIYVVGLDDSANAARNPFGMVDFWPYPLLGKHFPWEGRFIENPSMTYDASTNTYLLAYSAGDWWTASYSTGLARCSAPLGMCVSNAAGPWLASGNGRTGVGGLSFFAGADGSTNAAYASFAAGQEGPSQRRYGTAAGVTLGSAPSLGAP